jgi:hypothetical protein
MLAVSGEELEGLGVGWTDWMGDLGFENVVEMYKDGGGVWGGFG